ncbi:integrase [Acidihalobacter yilgarnensis]|uniref:Integrase n=2 Tax=Acidihalobacter yilgarnensis TaxID=2819280 RepID=A0A1D8IT90_9GAMM|nr:integrase [Acidihalobacter yilgarnensis]
MRPRKTDRHLPACMYLKHGAYWLVKRGKWTALGKAYGSALTEYARLTKPSTGGMPNLIERALPFILKDKSASTRKQYEQAARVLADALQEFNADQVTQADIADIKRAYADRPNMGNRILSVLRLIFHHAVEWGEIPNNPAIGMRRYVEAKRDRYLSDQEYAAIWAAGSDSLRAIMDVAYLTGQRIMDVLRLRLSDITDGGIEIRQGKPGQRMLVEMTPGLRDAIEAAKTLIRPARAMTLFCTMRGARPYAYRTVRDMYASASEKAGVANTTLHDLRAKALTDIDREGGDAQALGGHSSAAMTKRYLRVLKTVKATPPTAIKR